MSDSQKKPLNERYTFSLSIFITMAYLILPGFLEAIFPKMEHFQKTNEGIALLVWFNFWLISMIFVFYGNMKKFFHRKRDFKSRFMIPLSSLKLTVFLLSLSLILVFVGTLAQTGMGIWEVVSEYFRCFFSRVDLAIFIPGEVSPEVQRLHFFFPGGYVLGVALLVNLLSAHGLKFKVDAKGKQAIIGWLVTIAGLMFIGWAIWDGITKEDIPSAYVDSYKRVLYRLLTGLGATLVLLLGSYILFKKRAGVVVLHFGIILLLFSELVTGLYAREGTMTIEEGRSSSFVDLARRYEFSISDMSVGTGSEKSVVIPESYLKETGVWHSLEEVPFDFKVNLWYDNANLDEGHMAADAYEGLGKTFALKKVENAAGVENSAIDTPGMELELRGKDGSEMGRYIFSILLYLQRDSNYIQKVSVDGKSLGLMLRNERDYLYSMGSENPVRIKLLDFRHDKYLGTSTAKNFSSLIRLADVDKEIDRKVLISMNNPLRYTGRTFYQQSFAQDESGTVLQVVKNPGWMIPYLCCVIVGIGMLFQFCLTLIRFSNRKFA